MSEELTTKQRLMLAAFLRGHAVALREADWDEEDGDAQLCDDIAQILSQEPSPSKDLAELFTNFRALLTGEIYWRPELANAVVQLERDVAALSQDDVMRKTLEWYADQMCEGWCDNDPRACEAIGPDNCAGCPARQALSQTGEAP